MAEHCCLCRRLPLQCRLDMVAWQCGWERCLHRIRHEAAKAARPSACRFPLGDILQNLSEEMEAKVSLNVGCEFKEIHNARRKKSSYSQSCWKILRGVE